MPPYDGPLDAGAAVAALECAGETPYERGQGVYDDGLATVQDGPEEALDEYMREAGLGLVAPREGYAVEREGPGRVTGTGLRRDGRELWLGEDAAYLVSLDDPQDVERWPAATRPLWCS